jgi:hemoglobin
MTHRLLILALGLLVVAGGDATNAEENPLYKGGFPYNNAGTTPSSDDSLYRALGGSEKITAFTREFVGLIYQDEQIGKYFTGVDRDHLTAMLIAQFTELSGGPAHYQGRDMGETHKGLNISNSDFNRLAEDLQVAMDHNDVAFATQNRLVALLASMQRAVVTR